MSNEVNFAAGFRRILFSKNLMNLLDQQSSGGGLTSRPDDIHCHKSALVLNSHYFDNILEVEIAGDGNKLVTTPLPGNAYGSE